MAADKRDYYEVLGISKDATDDEIKRAYRKAAKANHPDLNSGDKAAEQRFKEVGEAYEVLSDSAKRQRYDQYGHAGVDPSFGAGGFDGGFGGFDFDLGSIFDQFFGGGTAQRQNAPARGENIRANVTISFEEAAFGVTKEVTVGKVEQCSECGGSGSAKGTTAEVCPGCKGTGSVKTVRQTAFGAISQSSTCSKCGGSGKIIHQPCTACKGKGKVRKNKKVSVNIPSGIDDGQTVSLRNQGNAGYNGGPSGDLLITVSVRPHPLFERDGTSVMFEMPVSFYQAVLGAELEVPTLDGKVKYAMPEGTQTGTTFRLRGKGIPVLGSKTRGDQYVTVIVDIPKNLNHEQKELLKKFNDSLDDNTRGDKKTFFDKIKDNFKN